MVVSKVMRNSAVTYKVLCTSVVCPNKGMLDTICHLVECGVQHSLARLTHVKGRVQLSVGCEGGCERVQ